MKIKLPHSLLTAIITTCLMLLSYCLPVKAETLEDYAGQWDYISGSIYSCPVISHSVDLSSIPAGHVGSAIYDLDMDGSDELIDIQIGEDTNILIDVYEKTGEEIVKQDSYESVYHRYEGEEPLQAVAGHLTASTSIFLYMTDRPEIAVETGGAGAFASGIGHTFVTHVYDGNSISRNHHYWIEYDSEFGSHVNQENYEELYSMGVQNDIDYDEFWRCHTSLREHVNEIMEICRVSFEINSDRTSFEVRFFSKDELDQNSAQEAPGPVSEDPQTKATSDAYAAMLDRQANAATGTEPSEE